MQQLQTDGSYNELYPKTDAWTKDETLSAQVASVLGLRDNYKPDDAFLGLYFGAGTYRYRVKVLFEDGTPIRGCTISGISAITGQTLVTNEKGIVIGKSTSSQVTIRVSIPYEDLEKVDSQTIVSNGIITDVIFSVSGKGIIQITSSKTLTISSFAKTVDVTAVGGGAGRNAMRVYNGNPYGGSRGGARKIVTSLNVSVGLIKIMIGAQASGGINSNSNYTGGTGRTTVVNIGENIITAVGGDSSRGGSGGYRYGEGGNSGYYHTNGVAGKDSTEYIFNDSSLGLAGGGSGRGGGFSYDSYHDFVNRAGGVGGAPNGGRGEDNSGAAASGASMGGGGGGRCYTDHLTRNGGAGGAGGVYLRFHF